MPAQARTPGLLQEVRKISALSLPLIVGQLSQMLLAVADTVMIGKVGVSELAALSFSNSIFGFPYIGGIGLLTAISVLGSNAHGENNPTLARKICRQGLILALAASLFLLILSLAIFPLLGHLGQPAAVVSLAPPYLFIVLISLIPALASIALKNYSDSLHCPWPAFWIFLGGVAINIPLNILLIYGWAFIPAMGLTGAGIATLISRCLMLLGMIIWLKKSIKLHAWVPRRFFHPWDFPTLKKLLHLGFPASMHLSAEVGTFSVAGLIIGTLGEKALAAHQIALTSASVAFMIPLGLAMALTVRMGNVGLTRDPAHARQIVRAGWLLTLLVTSLSCLAFFIFKIQIAAFYISDPALIQLAASLLIIIGFFQLVDGLQVASTGMLRGLHDVKVPAYTAFICYWLIGIPVGWLAATQVGLGSRGMWWGIALGLGIAAAILSHRLWKIVKKADAQ